MQHLDNQDLIALIVQKNEQALAELYDRSHRLIFSVAFNIVGRQEDAEEITLDVFTSVWEKAHTYQQDRAKPNTWLTRMARNKAIDLLRRENVRPSKHSISWSDVSPEPTSQILSPEAIAKEEAEKQRIRQAVAALPETQQEVLALAYFKGYSHSEIASTLDLPLGTVKGRIRSGMQKLRAALQDE